MKSYKKFLIILAVSIVLLALFNVQKVEKAQTILQTPFQMPCNTFQVQPYSYAGSVISNGSIKYLSLPSNSLPMGILYDNKTNKVWVALYWNRSIAEIDVATLSVTIYPMPWKVDDNYYGPLPWTLALAPDGCVWFSIRDYMVTPNHPPSYIPYLGKLDQSNNIIYIYYIPTELSRGCDIKFYNNYIWFLTNGGLSKINYITGEIVESYAREFSEGFIAPDGENLWISSVSGNFVTRFNITSESFDVNLTGFDRPLGMFVDTTKIYVAENSRSEGKLVVIDKATLNVSRIYTGVVITNEGTYHVYKSAFGNLWWSDNSGHVGCILLNGTKLIYNAPKYCYFMTEVPGNSIWFSAVGSAYIGIAEDIMSLSSVKNSGGISKGKNLLW
jgi:streptogramin lyase